MLIAKTIVEVRTVRWADSNVTWGLVPTMGALHEGHLSLVRRARAENDKVGVSIFVNPTQFNNPDDLARYPRMPERDCDLLRAEGVDLVWAPDPPEIYPPGYQTYVTVEEVTRPLEGASRPGHFRGVATVVAKFFNVFQPTRAYFGQKDAQQVAVIRQMARDLAFNLEIVTCPIVREADGLAMSSRNVRLSDSERKSAVVLYGALFGASEAWKHGERSANKLREMMTRFIEAEPLARIDYVSIADPGTLLEIEGRAEQALLSLAVFIGEVRLIDNMVVGN
ncbi:MAG: pantoate--beta-alanine ligase [Anaerolineae bacterium]|nr:pantoate--beta-alanine ligase [Anaerolineae bacterium]